jgi:hypothetical protein
MNTLGQSLRLHDQSGPVCAQSQHQTFTALAISATLSGELVISGIVDSNGTPVAWSLPPGTVAGVYAAPGSKTNGFGQVWYSLSDPADADKAVLAWAMFG